MQQYKAWDNAPGKITTVMLSRLQRALVAGAPSPQPRHPQIFQRPSREMKRPVFSFLKTAPSIVKVSLHACGDNSRCLRGPPRPHAFYLLSFCQFLFFARSCHWWIGSQCQHVGSAFTVLLFYHFTSPNGLLTFISCESPLGGDLEGTLADSCTHGHN
mgnify:CR=1 FL=1